MFFRPRVRSFGFVCLLSWTLGNPIPVRAYTAFIATPSMVDSQTGKLDFAALSETEEADLLLWREREVSFWVNPTIPEGETQLYSPEEIISTVQGALRIWNQAGSALHLKFAGVTDRVPGERDDLNIVGFVPTETFPDMSGQHPLGYAEPRGRLIPSADRSRVAISECDVLFSAQSIADSGTNWTFEHIVIHELGHCFGLGHSSIPESHMNYSDDRFGEEAPAGALSEDDRIGLLNLYPPRVRATNHITVQGTVTREEKPLYGASVTVINAQTGQYVASAVSGMTFDRSNAWQGYAVSSGDFVLRFLPPGEYFFLYLAEEESSWTTRLKDVDTIDLNDPTRERSSVEGPRALSAGSSLTLKHEIPPRKAYASTISDFFIPELQKWVPSQAKRLRAGKENRERYRVELTLPPLAYGELLWDPHQSGGWNVKFLSRSIEVRHPIVITYRRANGKESRYLEADLVLRANTAPGNLLMVIIDPQGNKYVTQAGIFLVSPNYAKDLEIFRKMDPQTFDD